MDDSFNLPKLFAALTKTLRLLELCLSLLLLSWILPRLPFALSFIRQFSLLLSSHIFVFLLSNAIIATLVVNSGRFSPPPAAAAADLDFLENPLLRVAEGEVVYQDKQIVSETNSMDCTSFQDKADTLASKDTDSEAGLDSDIAKVYRRTQSDKVTDGRIQQKLRRSETERKRVGNGGRSVYPQDKLSNEEFQRTIEAFIAKQMRFLREESLSIVIQKQS